MSHPDHLVAQLPEITATNKKYPVDSPKHIRAAWSYINHKDNAARYSADDAKSIKQRIRKAVKKQGVDIKG